MLLLRGLFLDPLNYDERRTAGIAQAVSRLKNKSRSFYLASATFEGRLRIDLILLYSFCRMADDLVDDAASIDEARSSVHKLRRFLDVAYSAEKGTEQSARLQELVKSEFPPNAQDALLLLPLEYLSAAPLYDLLRGFEMDLEFSSHDSGTRHKSWPIASEDDLELYSLRVAGTVAELCLDLVFHHASPDYSRSKRAELIQAGRNMGIALQLVNIARDVAVDAKLGRVYIPSIWLKDMELTPEDVLREPRDPKVEILQGSLLRKAEEIYREARSAIEQLPPNGRSGMRVAVESYMEIGRVLREKNYHVKSGRATVPKLRRIRVAWQALTRL
ncbi:MAG: hypothetical protein M1816_000823 [Peltula sp. TS41687]|nr:MAG: hypothetical protein M1816_000823 [Peltula sp. TS41687]